MPRYSIAGLQLNLDFDESLIAPEFSLFSVGASEENDDSVRIVLHNPESTGIMPDSRDMPAGSEYYHVKGSDGFYSFTYSETSALVYCEVDLPGKTAAITLRGVAGVSFSDSSEKAPDGHFALQKDLFPAIRDIFFLFALNAGLVPVHSSSIIYNDKAVLFSARSGTGKTTHTNFWVKKYGVGILNGDIAMLSLEDGKMYAYGLPWCGTSGQFMNRRVPLGAIVFLYRSSVNSASPISVSEGITSLLARTISPSFERGDVERNLRTITAFAEHTTFLRLCCTNSPNSVDAIKALLDLSFFP